VLPFNKWSANVPGTTYFLPVAELSAFYINILLSSFSEEFSYFVADERNNFKPAGIAKFARSKGGYLQDDPKAGRYATIGVLEAWLFEFAAIEQGGMLQNLGLMGEALGLGGFSHFAAHPFAWFEALGFRMQDIPFSRTIGAGPLTKTLIRTLGKELPVPTPVGFERNGEALIKPYCPPYYRDMGEAVRAFVDYKYSRGQHPARRRYVHELEGRGRRAGRYSHLLRCGDSSDHRLLRLRLQPLRTLPGEQRPVSNGAGPSSTPSG
jgi:hypothetical protein